MARNARSIVLLLPLCLVLMAVALTVQESAQFSPAPGSPFVIGKNVAALAVADANGDGTPDLFAVDADARQLRMLLGDGRGGFRPAGSPIAIGEPAHLLAAADFNADGRPDVALSAHDSNSVIVLLAGERGEFMPAPGSPFAAFTDVKPHNHGLAAGDVNGDGRQDLTLGHQETGGIAVLLGDGRGRFAPAAGSPFRLGRGFYPHALGDMNGDGRIDVVAPDILGSAIVVGIGDGRGTFAAGEGSPFAVKPRPYFVLLRDVNGDGRLDALATHDDSEAVDVLLGDGRGGFSAARTFNAGHRGLPTLATDLNRDGRQDVVIAGMQGLRAFVGDGKGGFTHAAEWSVATPRATWQLAVGDFNRDGRPDVAYAEFGAGTVSVVLHR